MRKGARAGVHRAAAAGARYAARRARGDALRRAAPAAFHRPGAARRPPGPAARRGHQLARRRGRAAGAAGPREARSWPHQAGDRASPCDRAARRPHHRDGSRRDRGAGHARRADARGRAVREPSAAAVSRLGGAKARAGGMRRLAAALLCFAFTAHAETLKVGSKRFTESYILGEILVQAAGNAVHRPGLGNTGIVFAALKAGSIDLYPEYTGTIAREILKGEGHSEIDELNRALGSQGLGVAVRLGFNNSYALAMREERAQALGIRSLSDLAKHAGLKLGLSQEFIGRADGWPGLKAAYGLPYATPSGLDHG